MAILYDRLGKNIRSLRKKKSLTQKQVAEILGCTSEHYSHVESGKRKIKLDALNTLCEVFDTSYEELLCGATNAQIRNENPSEPDDNSAIQEFAKIIAVCSEKETRWLLDLCWRIVNKPR